MTRPRVAIFASGSGTTTEAFIHESAAGNIEAEACVVICNNPDAGILERVNKLNKQYGLQIKTIVINNKTHPDETKPPRGEQTNAAQRAMIDVLKKENPDVIALMGYMKKIGPLIIDEFGYKSTHNSPYEALIVNTHPGLLPETKGLYGIHVQEHVVRNKLPYGGQTFHVVAQDYDEGPTIVEHKIKVKDGDTPESFFERVKKIEKKHLPQDIDAFIKKRRTLKKEEK